MSLLSIVVSVYNEEASLVQLWEVASDVMQSSLSQDEWEYELIFVNDGSTDQSRVILDGFAEKDKHCRHCCLLRNWK